MFSGTSLLNRFAVSSEAEACCALYIKITYLPLEVTASKVYVKHVAHMVYLHLRAIKSH